MSDNTTGDQSDPEIPELDEPDQGLEDETDDLYTDTEIEGGFDSDDDYLPAPPRPINWDLLSPEDAEHEWLTLNLWVNWLRKTYGLHAGLIPPYWHRHPELVWELSALHLHWLGAYDPEQDGSAPIGWHADFADARERLREWVTITGTKLDRDRPTRQTIWPGEETPDDGGEVAITDRDQDFVDFVTEDVLRRRESPDTGNDPPSV